MKQLQQAVAVGQLIAERGHTVVCGGLGGVMEAVCRGARQAGGPTIGILPGEDGGAANAYVDFAIATGLSVARNAVVAQSGAAMIAIGGSFGTLSEIAFGLQFGKPVVGLGTWRLKSPDGESPMLIAESPETAVELAVRLASAAGAEREG